MCIVVVEYNNTQCYNVPSLLREVYGLKKNFEHQLNLFEDLPLPEAFVPTTVGCWYCWYEEFPRCYLDEESSNCTDRDCKYSGILTRQELKDDFYNDHLGASKWPSFFKLAEV